MKTEGAIAVVRLESPLDLEYHDDMRSALAEAASLARGGEVVYVVVVVRTNDEIQREYGKVI
jgi:hypothetical protein